MQDGVTEAGRDLRQANPPGADWGLGVGRGRRRGGRTVMGSAEDAGTQRGDQRQVTEAIG